MRIPKKVCDRLNAGMKQLGPIIEQQRSRDISEADTVTLVKDLLSEVLGFDKYADITGEFAIRGTYCDLAVRIDEKVVLLIEVKAIGIPLDDRHVKQAVDYASNHGVEWVILTNGINWRLYQVIFAKPIDKRLISEFDITSIDCRRDDGRQVLFPFTKEGFVRGAHVELRDRKDATSHYLIAALLLNNDTLVSTIRRELRRVVDANVTEPDILKVLREQVIKREAIEGQAAIDAARRCNRKEDRPLRRRASKSDNGESTKATETLASNDVHSPAVSPDMKHS